MDTTTVAPPPGPVPPGSPIAVPPPFPPLTHHELRTLRELAKMGVGNEDRGALVGVAACNTLLLYELVGYAQNTAAWLAGMGSVGFPVAATVTPDPTSATAFASGAAALVTANVTAALGPVQQLLQTHATEIASLKAGATVAKPELGTLEAEERVLKRHVHRLEVIEAGHLRLVSLLESLEPRVAHIEAAGGSLPKPAPRKP